MEIDKDLVKIIKDEVKGGLREALDNFGLKDFLNTGFYELDFDIGDIILPFVQYESNDSEFNRLKNDLEFDQLYAKSIAIAKAEFCRIMDELHKADAIINAAFEDQKLEAS